MTYFTVQEYNAMDMDVTNEVASTSSRYSLEITGVETVGFRTDLLADYFKLKSSVSKIYHYDAKVKVAFNQSSTQSESEGQVVRNLKLSSVPEEKCKEVMAELLKFNKRKNFKYIYDGKKNLFTSTELPVFRKSTFTVWTSDEKYEIAIKPRKKSHGTNALTMPILQTMDLNSETDRNDLLELNKILERRRNSDIHFDRYFSVSQVDKFDIGNGLEIWRGYEQSINITQTGPAYVLNISELVFHKSGPVIDYINELLGCDITESNRPLTPEEIKKIKSALHGVLVYSTHLPYRRRYFIEDVSDLPASDILVPATSKLMSVADYFGERYCRLLFPHFPCFRMRSNTKYPAYLPLETCVIFEGQQKLDYHSTDTQEKASAVGNFSSNVLNKRSVKEFKLFTDLSQKVFDCRGISLTAPRYLEESQIHHDTRKWGIKGRFSKLSKNDSWIVLSFVDETQLPLTKITKFLDQLTTAGSCVGLRFGKFLGTHISGRDEPIEKAFQKEEIKNATLAVILLSKSSSHNYDDIKFIADYRLGIVTKCVLDYTIYMLNKSIAINICLSIDAKLKGLTYQPAQTLKIFSQPMIVFGAVITNLKEDTIASVAGSLDAYPSKYQISCRVQEEKKSGKVSKEYITDLANMAKSILNSFYHHTKGKYPEKIIFFRNSATSPNFNLLRYFEVKALQKTCKDIVGSIIPITYIVVTKHNTPKSNSSNKTDGVRTNQHIGSNSKDFTYHLSCDKTTYYYVIHNDNRLSDEELQEMTHHLCYIHAGSKYISGAIPISYALRAALRAKKYAHCHLSKCQKERGELPDFVIDAINKMERIEKS